MLSFPVPFCFQRKEEREIAMYGRVLSSENADADGLQNEGISNDDDEMETADASLSGEHMNWIL